MKLSEVLRSQPICTSNDNDGNGSWGIFISPADSSFVVKLLFDEEQFTDEKTGYDKAIGDPGLEPFVDRYSEIDIELDLSADHLAPKPPPFRRALLLPYLRNPPWEEVGKLGDCETDKKLAECGIDVDKIKNDFHRIGVTPWETTIFLNQKTNDIKAIDLTYSETVLNSYENENSGH